jgi:hypothetical protein
LSPVSISYVCNIFYYHFFVNSLLDVSISMLYNYYESKIKGE